MMTARLYAALLGLAAALSSASGCSEVESCVQGIDPGCLGSAPDNSGNCRFGLVLSADGLTCGTSADAGTQPRNDGGNSQPDNCPCPAGQLCRANGACVDLCQPLTNVPALKDPPLSCRPTEGEGPYDFARAAQGACSQACVHRAALCNTTCDPATECTSATAMLALTTQCPTRDPECAMRACETARDLPCAQQQCPGNAAPDCSGVLCSNGCDMPEFNLDGVCDDGDLATAISYVCPYGTDCGDCGPRRGTAPSLDLDYGDPCVDPLQCGGDLFDVRNSTGWCVPPTDRDQVGRCIADCSSSRSCRPGFECVGLSYPDPDGAGPQQGETVVDLGDGTAVYACFPMQCGN